MPGTIVGTTKVWAWPTKKLPNNQPQFSLAMMRQYWLGKTKPKQGMARNAFNKLLQTFKNLLKAD